MCKWSHRFGIYESTISCGIKQLNHFITDSDIFSFSKLVVNNNDCNKILKDIFKNFIKQIKSRHNCSMIILSTNKSAAPKFSSILNTMTTDKVGYRRNPNSGNMIRLWIL